MKININRHILETNKNIDEFKLMVASDFHYNQNFNIQRFNIINEVIKHENPDYICIPGDIIDQSTGNYNEIINFIKEISNHTQIFISLGNHDIMKKENNKWFLNINTHFFNEIEKIKNVKLFRNRLSDNYKIKNLSFNGFNPSFDWYEKHKENSETFKAEFLDYLFYNEIDNNTYNILLTHSPSAIINNKLNENLIKNYDLILSGHLHGGLMPFPLTKRGIIDPQGNLFPLSQGKFNIDETSIIVSRGISKLPSTLSFLNKFYKPDIDIVKVKKLESKY